MKNTLPAFLSAAAMLAASPAAAHHHHEDGAAFMLSLHNLVGLGAVFLGALAVFFIATRLFRAQRQAVRPTTKRR